MNYLTRLAEGFSAPSSTRRSLLQLLIGTVSLAALAGVFYTLELTFAPPMY